MNVFGNFRVREGQVMSGSIYKIIEIVGTSKASWEDAAKTAVETAAKSLEDLRVAEVVKLDLTIDESKVTAYRTRLAVSFKYHGEK
jgi:flavin-binding protein dodecin